MSVEQIDTGTDELLCNVDERVATITLNRPEKRNALSDNLTPALRQTLLDLEPAMMWAALLSLAPVRHSVRVATLVEWPAVNCLQMPRDQPRKNVLERSSRSRKR